MSLVVGLLILYIIHVAVTYWLLRCDWSYTFYGDRPEFPRVSASLLAIIPGGLLGAAILVLVVCMTRRGDKT